MLQEAKKGDFIFPLIHRISRYHNMRISNGIPREQFCDDDHREMG
jgi:hypothetical protein